MSSVTQIPTTSSTVLAFNVDGEIQSEDLEVMAQIMNDAFDQHDDVNLLLIFRPYEGTETGATLNWEVVKSNFRSLSNLNKYAVVGGADAPKGSVDFMDRLIPIDAETFGHHEASAAWDFVGAAPQAESAGSRTGSAVD